MVTPFHKDVEIQRRSDDVVSVIYDAVPLFKQGLHGVSPILAMGYLIPWFYIHQYETICRWQNHLQNMQAILC